jgi:hypothetical protein
MRCSLALAAICFSLPGALAAQADPFLPPSAPTLNQTLDSFQPTPKQTIAIRDFLGRSDRIAPQGQSADGLFYFDLRDANNQRIGQIAVGRDNAEHSIFIARVSGPAVFDPSRRARMPRATNTKMRASISAALAGAEAGPVYEAATAASRDLFLRIRPGMAIAPQPTAAPDRIIELEASFFSDGSGIVRGIRAPVGAVNVTTPIHVSAKFLPALEGDGKRAFRENAVGVDADFAATLGDFGNKLPCPPGGCPPSAPIVIKGDLHLTTWRRAVVPSAPANLIAQISPPPPLPPILQDPLEQPAPSIDATGTPPSPAPDPILPETN